ILDFFAGSGTTAQAVMELNKKDGGNRKFILCQIDELINAEKKKEAFDFCLKNGLEPIISSITIERVKRAGEKILTEIKEQKNLLNQEDKGLDVGFKVFDLIETSKIIEDINHQFSLALSNNDSLSN
ncbi:MAG: site-specific DNA-methyltransferase, partial [Rickettsiales bacterium]|nr:site-specific DNA-methyltransferase [Rickettsiales bacterium]